MNKIGKCPNCGKTTTIIPSNNPIVVGLCESCLHEQIDIKNMVMANFFCRTYNIPLLPEKWIAIAEESPDTLFNTYTTIVKNEYPDTLYNDQPTGDLWNRVQKEWDKNLTRVEILEKIQPIKEEYITGAKLFWGQRFSFDALINMDDLYASIVQSNGITVKSTLDIVKKYCIVSSDMEQCLNDHDIKGAADYSKMMKDLIKTAGLDEAVEAFGDNVIANFSQYTNYLEQKGFQPEYYNGVSQDAIDKAIEDIQEYTKRLVQDAVGLSTTYSVVEEQFNKKKEIEVTDKAISSKSLDELVQEARDGANKAIDDELASDTLDGLGDAFEE